MSGKSTFFERRTTAVLLSLALSSPGRTMTRPETRRRPTFAQQVFFTAGRGPKSGGQRLGKEQLGASLSKAVVPVCHNQRRHLFRFFCRGSGARGTPSEFIWSPLSAGCRPLCETCLFQWVPRGWREMDTTSSLECGLDIRARGTHLFCQMNLLHRRRPTCLSWWSCVASREH